MKKVNKVLLHMGVIATIIGISPCWTASDDSLPHLQSGHSHALDNLEIARDEEKHWIGPNGIERWLENEEEHWYGDDGLEHWKDESGKEYQKAPSGKMHRNWIAEDGLEHWKDESGKEYWKDQDGQVHTCD